MTNYIAYILLSKIKKSDYLNNANLSLKSVEKSRPVSQSSSISSLSTTSNLILNSSFTGSSNLKTNYLKEMAREILSESENEPCGLKGAKISIYLEQNELKNESQPVKSNHLISEFRFDTSCFLTTFELVLVLKEDFYNKQSTGVLNNLSLNVMNSSTNTNLSASSIATLTRRLFSRSPKSMTGKTLTNSSFFDESSINRTIFLDANNFDLVKRKLY